VPVGGWGWGGGWRCNCMEPDPESRHEEFVIDVVCTTKGPCSQDSSGGVGTEGLLSNGYAE
jgi:hypothetical protein